MAISIYDMDRTITRGGTWGPWLRFWLRRHAPWRIVLLPLLGLAGAAYATRIIDRGALKATAHRLLMGRRLPRSLVMAAAADYADKVVANGCFEAALEQIAADRAAGCQLVLATASNAYYAEAIGTRLGFDAVIATPSRWIDNQLDWRLGDANCYGQEKRKRVAAWLDQNAKVGDPLRFHSDHQSDAPVFLLVSARGGKAFATNATAELTALAQKNGWPQVIWGQPRKSLFERA
ncbi:hypothetical protein GCM10007973_04800 [Polymorphobacter multimanifer]|uniref:HAD superfamily phosphoserine phosphatase-like hydrolase n=1 Tax=Polymorphobacter multimanifer TaxID=1070431 RepID=A0A841L4A5_9SPHN|nr:HAD-IB family phosphatase [Polymorphobacter multimanifer]MBB6227689.1 HAD superfamily phosphoserine phosphatase-like hydrolase [Polymorphobacter multimanifer]GGI70877.1 hypothetical protein GCM10007973_04800 [Polymorphobacter multimanifer]